MSFSRRLCVSIRMLGIAQLFRVLLCAATASQTMSEAVMLTNASQVVSLNSTQANLAMQVLLHGVVTRVDKAGHYMVVQDGKSAVKVKGAQDLAVTEGDLVAVKGKTAGQVSNLEDYPKDRLGARKCRIFEAHPIGKHNIWTDTAASCIHPKRPITPFI